jgi:hypothetical protein
MPGHGKSVGVRLDERVLDSLKSKGPGHLTLINDILANRGHIAAANDHGEPGLLPPAATVHLQSSRGCDK